MVAPSGGSACAWAAGDSAATPSNVAANATEARPRATERSCKLDILFHQIGVDRAAHCLALTLHLGGQCDCPGARHAWINFEPVNAGLRWRQRFDWRRHRWHSGRPHVDLHLEDDSVRHGFSIRHVHHADLDDVLGIGHLRLCDQLEPVIGSGSRCGGSRSDNCESSECEDEGKRCSAAVRHAA
jgi:hypothetical protein